MWNLVGKIGFLMMMHSILSSNDLIIAKENIFKAQGKVYDSHLRQKAIWIAKNRR